MIVTPPNSETRLARASRTATALALLVGTLLSGTAAIADELKVTATIKPIHALVAQVMEGVGAPSLLVRGAASPHTYALKPSDARALHQADVFFRVSETVEPFTSKIVEALPESVRVVTLADSPGIELLPIRRGETFEAHDHDHSHGADHKHDHHDHGKKKHGGHDHKHGHGHKHDHDHDHKAADHAHHDHDHDHAEPHAHAAHEIDGHVWLDPQNARKMLTEIARALSEAAPDHADTFRANANRAAAALDTLEAEIARDLAPVKGKPYVVFHDAYQYFERRFDLAPVGSITLSPEVRPSAKRLTEIRQRLGALEASCVFAEPQFQPRLVEAVIEGTTARAGTLDPEGALLEPGPAAYETLLRNLTSGLKACLAPQS
ncbi:zinc transporter [Hyphomicrobium nitrativorans NL23]|uniref:High-affinity zinc uptake system protein ZnuA n=1 Tax=Hyphomicrobium nitrativorans NL23 TaxID=1029756 RepID=V5SCM1_9HYPH|nr:zinc ABC transporter substrate-binding protein [Hyphomicrobium nitrativorans]AHB48268.1 zinc transporter [Hyphomicrobium nitrativorans NL23]